MSAFKLEVFVSSLSALDVQCSTAAAARGSKLRLIADHSCKQSRVVRRAQQRMRNANARIGSATATRLFRAFLCARLFAAVHSAQCIERFARKRRAPSGPSLKLRCIQLRSMTKPSSQSHRVSQAKRTTQGMHRSLPDYSKELSQEHVRVAGARYSVVQQEAIICIHQHFKLNFSE